MFLPRPSLNLDPDLLPPDIIKNEVESVGYNFYEWDEWVKQYNPNSVTGNNDCLSDYVDDICKLNDDIFNNSMMWDVWICHRVGYFLLTPYYEKSLFDLDVFYKSKTFNQYQKAKLYVTTQKPHDNKMCVVFVNIKI